MYVNQKRFMHSMCRNWIIGFWNCSCTLGQLFVYFFLVQVDPMLQDDKWPARIFIAAYDNKNEPCNPKQTNKTKAA